VLDSQLPQPLDVLEQVGIDVVFFVAHEVAAFVGLRYRAAPDRLDAIG
jgi:hypothetical protein